MKQLKVECNSMTTILDLRGLGNRDYFSIFPNFYSLYKAQKNKMKTKTLTLTILLILPLDHDARRGPKK